MKRKAEEGLDEDVRLDEDIRPDAPNEVPFEIEANVPEDSEIAYAVVADEQSLTDEASVAEDDEDADTSETMEPSSSRSAWRRFASEDMPQLSLREILGGDYLIAGFLRRQILFILFLVVLAIAYISNRYGAQQEIIEEENLRKELLEKKNYALTQYAELTMQTRQSSLERRLKSMGDSTLVAAKEPPFFIVRKE